MSTKTKDYDYFLPKNLIAQSPLEPRDSSRLLVIDKKGELEHRTFADITSYLRPGDVLVRNNTRVIPARIYGSKDTGARIEFLLLKRQSIDTWEIILRPARRTRVGTKVRFGDGLLTGEIVEELPGGNRLVKFSYEGVFEDILERIGNMPLPPYITQKLADKRRYNTVYSRQDGSAAAPTAGLHFTDELLQRLQEQGVIIVDVLLHVGLGTFRPVCEQDIACHQMHSEYYEVKQEAADMINLAKREGRRVIAVGTTSTRVLETVAGRHQGQMAAETGETQIFIYPGYEYQIINGLITNFHLPQSTLIMMVAALVGREKILEAYQQAVEREYRFFSFGDAMLIFPPEQ